MYLLKPFQEEEPMEEQLTQGSQLSKQALRLAEKTRDSMDSRMFDKKVFKHVCTVVELNLNKEKHSSVYSNVCVCVCMCIYVDMCVLMCLCVLIISPRVCRCLHLNMQDICVE